MKISMKLTDTTKGALIYSAVDADGNELGMRDVAVSKLYVRKDHIDGEPQTITLTLDAN